MERSEYLLNGRWRVNRAPFKHCLVDNVFTDPAYRRVAAAFDAKLASSAGRSAGSANYDATIVPFEEADREPFFPS